MRGMRGARKTPEQELEETRAELASAEEKQARWAARVAELRDSVTAQENTLILGAVRSVAASPEELRGLLNMIQGKNQPPAAMKAGEQPFAGMSGIKTAEQPPLEQEELEDEE